ncbi:MAG: 50S ribosomal protein L13 [Eubacteriaceae bacterium]|nr:50S ribosomal protein L13 [Eubacteriaceae bacterium]
MNANATKMAKSQEVEHKWYVVDATDKVLGRLATEVATILRGKNKPFFTPHVDCGDYVIIVNADKVKLTGKKLDQKVYKTFSGYPGGLKEVTYRKMMEDKPEVVVYHAVRGMVPHGALGDAVMKKLRVYAGPDHPHAAQQPEALSI